MPNIVDATKPFFCLNKIPNICLAKKFLVADIIVVISATVFLNSFDISLVAIIIPIPKLNYIASIRLFANVNFRLSRSLTIVCFVVVGDRAVLAFRTGCPRVLLALLPAARKSQGDNHEYC